MPVPPSANTPLGSGLIHRTLLSDDSQYVWQEMNTVVFPDLQAIEQNILAIEQHKNSMHPNYQLVLPLHQAEGRIFRKYHGGWWRVMPYVPESVAHVVATDTDQAYTAAKAFGGYAKMLTDAPVSAFRETIREFHNLEKYAMQLERAIKVAQPEPLKKASVCIDQLNKYSHLRSEAKALSSSSAFPLRVLHHDAKLSNLLVHKSTGTPISVIDLDTTMPGKIYSDIGDLIRSCACAQSEETQQPEARPAYILAALEGYREAMFDQLTEAERNYLPKAGAYLTYMQAIRFLSDYLVGNRYYKVDHPEQNLNRAKGQCYLLAQL